MNLLASPLRLFSVNGHFKSSQPGGNGTVWRGEATDEPANGYARPTVLLWWGEATDEPEQKGSWLNKAAREDARPTEIFKSASRCNRAIRGRTWVDEHGNIIGIVSGTLLELGGFGKKRAN